jgi:hypothetical protein
MASAISIPHRPFGAELITGLQLPDGFFETSLGTQRINAYFQNTTGGVLNNIEFYIESVSDPGIIITPQTYILPSLPAGASRLNSWIADFSGATPGTQMISFVAKMGGGTKIRIIKKIFITQVGYNPATKTFSVFAPEGILQAQLVSMVGPKRAPCCCGKRRDELDAIGGQNSVNLFKYLSSSVAGKHDREFRFCLKQYLLGQVKLQAINTPPYAGQIGDLPYQDPWWKVLLCILAFLLLVAAAIAEAVGGSGEISTTGGPGGAGSPTGDCCGLAPSGGGTSYVAAGLVAAAAAAATAAALSDAKDPFRRGQEATSPAAGELTVSEDVTAELFYSDPVQLGKPFKITAKWDYVRHTTGSSYGHSLAETNENIHVISKYEIEAPDVVRRYKKEDFLVKARFYDTNGKLVRGNQLFVQCFLCGPNGEYLWFPLRDDGIDVDKEANDGTYTGQYSFWRHESPCGYWKYFVIAQDINTATTDLKPEQAAAIIGGMVLTGQLTIDYSGGTCSFVEDGVVNVIC